MSVIIKIAPGNHINRNAVANVVRYIHTGTLNIPEHERLTGCFGFPDDSDPEAVIRGMMKTKKIYHAEEGVQCKHIIVSFGKKPCIPRKKLKKVMKRIAGFWKTQFQVFWGIHHNKSEDGENYHLHMMLNSVNMKTGRKIDISNKLWRKFVMSTNRTWEKAVKKSDGATGR